MPGGAHLYQIGEDLADNRSELESMPGAGRGDYDLRISCQEVEDEMLVRGIGEQAGAQRHGRAVGRWEVASRRLTQGRFVDRGRLPLEIVGDHLLPEMMVETDLEARHVIMRESVVTSFRNHQVEYRKPLRGEKRRLQGRKPAEYLPLWLCESGQCRDERAHPRSGREHETSGFIDAALGGYPHTVAERFPADHSLLGTDLRTCRQGTFDL